MKRILIGIAALLYIMQVTAQEQPVVKDREFYLKKSKNQNTTAWVLAVSGVVIFIGGSLGAQDFEFMSTNSSEVDRGLAFMLGGTIVGASSIPFFVSSAKNKRKAAAMAGPGIQPIHLGGSLTRLAPGITIKIQF